VHSCSSQWRLQSWRGRMRSSRRAHESKSVIMTATVMSPTPLEGAGPVAHRGTTVENLRLLVMRSWQKNYPLSE
jgi:hypothetical protein